MVNKRSTTDKHFTGRVLINSVESAAQTKLIVTIVLIVLSLVGKECYSQAQSWAASSQFPQELHIASSHSGRSVFKDYTPLAGLKTLGLQAPKTLLSCELKAKLQQTFAILCKNPLSCKQPLASWLCVQF